MTFCCLNVRECICVCVNVCVCVYVCLCVCVLTGQYLLIVKDELIIAFNCTIIYVYKYLLTPFYMIIRCIP